MKYTGAAFGLMISLSIVKAFSISGMANFNRTGLSAGGAVTFPRFPNLAAALSLFGHTMSSTSSANATNNNNNVNNNNNSTSNLMSNFQNIFNVPDAQSLIPDFSSLANTPDVDVFPITGLTDLSQLSSIPALSTALEDARQRITEALQLGSNFTTGIQQAIQEAFAGNDPTAALRTIVDTILSAYINVAANCPIMIVASRVLQEGIRLAIEVARSAQNVILGTSTTTVAS